MQKALCWKNIKILDSPGCWIVRYSNSGLKIRLKMAVLCVIVLYYSKMSSSKFRDLVVFVNERIVWVGGMVFKPSLYLLLLDTGPARSLVFKFSSFPMSFFVLVLIIVEYSGDPNTGHSNNRTI